MNPHPTQLSNSSPMISVSHSIIAGGSFTQHHLHNTSYTLGKTGFDRLQDAVAPGAFHNSGERFDPPKCHPNTRVAVIQKILDWVLRQDSETKDAFIMWLHGPAGAGKSAIAQSIAELCFADGQLLASFFFARSDPNRNHAGSLFATIAYQIALALPEMKQSLVAIIEHDPLIFTRSLSAQFMSLIVTPLLAFIHSTFFFSSNLPRLIIIDGLDECLGREAQRQILDVIIRGTQQYHLPLIFLISSRPEHQIATRLNCQDTESILTRLVLDHSYFPECDIEQFLRDKFIEITNIHPFRRFIPSSWPTDDVIKQLVQKSSGQFIYAYTVVKYVESSRHRPHIRLEVILNIRPSCGELPFAEVDALYTHILSSVDNIKQVLHIISFQFLISQPVSVDALEIVLSLEPGEIEVLFCDLLSVVAFREEGKRVKLHILHASLLDFLFDQSRSKQFHIDLSLECTEHLRKSIQYLTDDPSTDPQLVVIINQGYRLAMTFFEQNCTTALPTDKLRQDIAALSIARIYRTGSTYPGRKLIIPVPRFNIWFLPSFFNFIKESKFPDTEFLYAHHLHSFDEVLKRNLEIYYADIRLTFLVALLPFYFSYTDDECYRTSNPVTFPVVDKVHMVDRRRLSLSSAFELSHPMSGFVGRDYCQLIYNFLEDSSRSEQCRLDGSRYADVALFCLSNICALCSNSQAMSSSNAKHNHEIREKSSHLGRDVYVFGLEYFIYFLERAGHEEELLKFCSWGIFDPCCVSLKRFPHQAERGRKAITNYLQRIDK